LQGLRTAGIGALAIEQQKLAAVLGGGSPMTASFLWPLLPICADGFPRGGAGR
jgi:hypothetical protein